MGGRSRPVLSVLKKWRDKELDLAATLSCGGKGMAQPADVSQVTGDAGQTEKCHVLGHSIGHRYFSIDSL